MKIVDIVNIREICGRARAAGRKIVFTNGCFDLIHPGHIYSLHRARAEGDMLVVGLNSDSSVRALKGENRPIFSERERAETLAALSVVDNVVVFSEETPLNLILAVMPDVLAKGGDYSPESVVGRAEVEANGGRLMLIPNLPGFSTTSLFEKLKK